MYLNVIQWVPEVSNACPGVPYLLIGCKNDLRTDSALQFYLTVPGQEPEESDSISRIQVCIASLTLKLWTRMSDNANTIASVGTRLVS